MLQSRKSIYYGTFAQKEKAKCNLLQQPCVDNTNTKDVRTPEQNKHLTFVFHLNLYQQVNRNLCMNKKKLTMDNAQKMRKRLEGLMKMLIEWMIQILFIHLYPICIHSVS